MINEISFPSTLKTLPGRNSRDNCVSFMIRLGIERHLGRKLMEFCFPRLSPKSDQYGLGMCFSYSYLRKRLSQSGDEHHSLHQHCSPQRVNCLYVPMVQAAVISYPFVGLTQSSSSRGPPQWCVDANSRRRIIDVFPDNCDSLVYAIHRGGMAISANLKNRKAKVTGSARIDTNPRFTSPTHFLIPVINRVAQETQKRCAKVRP
jgi:hypothetical protein